MNAFLDSPIFVRLIPVLKVIIVLVVGKILLGIMKRFASKIMDKAKVDKLIRSFVTHTAEILVYVVIILSVLNILGFDSTSVVTVLAAGGAAVALALKDSLSNLAGGILLMVTKSFGSGDYINACGVEGTVQGVDLLHTTIITGDGQTVIIPNGSLTTNNITNQTIKGTRRIQVEIGVSYDTDLDRAREILINLAKGDPRTLSEPAPFCAVNSYGDNAVNLILRVWCKASDYWDLRFTLLNKMKPTLDAEKIEIPFPQLDVHMKEK